MTEYESMNSFLFVIEVDDIQHYFFLFDRSGKCLHAQPNSFINHVKASSQRQSMLSPVSGADGDGYCFPIESFIGLVSHGVVLERS